MNLSNLDVRRALVVGDQHGNLFSWARKILPAAINQDCDVIVQVGDFGFGWSPDYLPALDAMVDELDAPEIFWLDGNHENFDELEEIGAFGADDPFVTSEHTTYLPRGYMWKWQGVRCMAMGGAYSVDKEHRTPHHSWWEQEEITDADVRHAREQADWIDVLFAHDCYDGVVVPGIHAAYKQGLATGDMATVRMSEEFARLSKPNREKLSETVRALEVQMYVHGHFHEAYEDSGSFTHGRKSKRNRLSDLFPRNIIGLNLESEHRSCITLDFPTLDWAWTT